MGYNYSQLAPSMRLNQFLFQLSFQKYIIDFVEFIEWNIFCMLDLIKSIYQRRLYATETRKNKSLLIPFLIDAMVDYDVAKKGAKASAVMVLF